MLRLSPSPNPLIKGQDVSKGTPHSFLNHTPLQLSESNLREFLGQSRKTRLTPRHDFAHPAPFELVARSRGKPVLAEWLEGMSPFRAIHELQGEMPTIDTFQLTVVTGLIPLEADRWRQTLSARKTGRFGLEVMLSGTKYRVSPLQSIATNRSLEKFLASLLEEKHLAPESFFKSGGKLSLLECRQFILHCRKSADAVETYRGARLIKPDSPPEMLAERLVSGIARWFMFNQDTDGALPYKYWPSVGIYSEADNPIRRFMASVAFNRMASAMGRQEMRVAARKNLEYNLRRFYRIENNRAVIAWNDSVKLGSLALAALAILESPFAERWKTELGELHKTIDGLWHPSGEFKTFLYPEDRNDNQNFYPGEALLFWATSLQKEPNEVRLSKALQSFHFYRGHFKKNSNPAFVPWHTQALAILYRITGEVALRNFVFEMNDWLLFHQQWGGSVDPDHWGRFYSPSKPEYGPPHASATGVYLEGLVDAWSLAKEAGDNYRAAAYRQAIERGIRSLAQLQFYDDLDAYYVSHKDRVIGAIRTETYNNEIRIDNLQHGVMAVLKYQELIRGDRRLPPSKRQAQATQPVAAQ